MVFFIFIISHKQKTLLHTPSLSHARTDTYSLSLSLYRIQDTPHTNKTYNSSLSLVSRHTLNLSPHTCKTGFLSLHHTHSLFLSLYTTHTLFLSLTHTRAMYTLCIYLCITYGFQSYLETFRVWVWYEYWRMSIARMGRMVRTMIMTLKKNSITYIRIIWELNLFFPKKNSFH